MCLSGNRTKVHNSTGILKLLTLISRERLTRSFKRSQKLDHCGKGPMCVWRICNDKSEAQPLTSFKKNHSNSSENVPKTAATFESGGFRKNKYLNSSVVYKKDKFYNGFRKPLQNFIPLTETFGALSGKVCDKRTHTNYV